MRNSLLVNRSDRQDTEILLNYINAIAKPRRCICFNFTALALQIY